jgi:hypothetical protein
MVVEIVFNVSPTTVVYGHKVTISGSVHENGSPLTGQNVQIRHVDSGVMIHDLWTDASGNYTVDWYPGAEWIGAFQIQAFVPIYAGEYSSPVTVNVLAEAPSPKPNFLWLLLIPIGIVIYKFLKK